MMDNIVNAYIDEMKDYVALLSDFQDMERDYAVRYADTTWRCEFRRTRQHVAELAANLRYEYRMLITLRDMEGLDVLLPKPPEE